mgnify:CR=1 FL=1
MCGLGHPGVDIFVSKFNKRLPVHLVECLCDVDLNHVQALLDVIAAELKVSRMCIGELVERPALTPCW